MINNEVKEQEKLDELLKTVEISEEEFEQLDYKGKQEYFKTKTKLASVFHKSKDKNGIGITYVKKEN